MDTMTPPVTGEIEARLREILAEEHRGYTGMNHKPEQYRADHWMLKALRRAYSLDRASVDGVLGALATISTMTPNYLDGRFEDHASLVRRLKEVARAALSAVSIPRGKVVVTDELVAAIAQSYNSSVEGFGEKIYQGSLRNALEAALPLPPAGGWRLVPVEPTEEMQFAFISAMANTGEGFSDSYRAMLAAAPAPPASGKEAT